MDWRAAVAWGLGVLMMAGCGPVADDGTTAVTGPSLPDGAAGWVAAGEVETYDTESIYGYIDGHAEVYMAYGMKRCLTRRYAAPSGDDEIVLDLFEMASPADAYGVFSHDREGEEVAVGQGGVYRLGWLSFWSGPWVGSVYATGDSEAARDAVFALADAAAAGLPADGDVPELVSALPEEGLDPASVCFLRSPQILNAHVFVGQDNVFALGPGCEAVVGAYAVGDRAVHLLIVRYPDEAAAAAAENGLTAAGSSAPEMLVGRDGRVIAAVIGEGPGEGADGLLDRALGGGE